MKTIKVSEATNLQLDWLVAKCMAQVHKDQILNGTTMYGWWISGLFVDTNYWIRLDDFKPSSNWAQGGPIIERERIYLMRNSKHQWVSTYAGARPLGYTGPTPLIAAMRCYVASKLGKTAEVPEELLP